MRSNQPPIVIDGFHHQHALTGIAVRNRPSWATRPCPTCSGRGARNDFLHLDSMRCRLAACGDCDGAGWTAADGTRHRPDIVMRNGHPAWTIAVVPAPRKSLPPCLLPLAAETPKPPVADEASRTGDYAEAA